MISENGVYLAVSNASHAVNMIQTPDMAVCKVISSAVIYDSILSVICFFMPNKCNICRLLFLNN
jgi:hypothetical protein